MPSLLRVELEPDPRSVRDGRRAVMQALEHVGAPADAIHAAALATSEVVTNALLHGRPPLALEISTTPAVLRVAVTDGSEDQAIPRHVGAMETGGRGLALVEAVASRWGVERQAGGKAVWFEIPTGAATSPERPLHRVRLLGVPVDAYLRGQEQLDAMLRELHLLALADEDALVHIDRRVGTVLRRIMSSYRTAREQGRQMAEAAASAGQALVDLEVDLPADAADAAQAYASVIGELERCCHDGLLLSAPPDDAVVRLRRWLAEEIVCQLRDGRAPVAFG